MLKYKKFTFLKPCLASWLNFFELFREQSY